MELLKKEDLNSNLNKQISDVYKKFSFNVSNYEREIESKDYYACRFKINDLQIISRTAKITPKKAGQFVTFWKREINHLIMPFDEHENVDFFIVNVQQHHKMGQFVFPKAIMIEKGIISTVKKEGKRAFRVYPPWDIAESKQATASQKWQINYFYEILDGKDLAGLLKLYEK